ncbi:MAG: hypothetical protein HLUCCA04_07970 [Oceanicaulis sp. HLUCCA04]|nr:MAG: hypothetical protein HLUCCA04_07970 [Oceanicaulis sp. HLUCCA04]
MTGRFSYITRILEPEGLMYVRIFGVNRPDLSRDRGGMLLDRVARGGINAVIFDYRRMVYTHDTFQIGTLAGRVASRLPAGFPVAYVLGRQHAGFVVTLMRTLTRKGIITEPFASHRPAIAWANHQIALTRAAAIAGRDDPAPHARSA